MLLSPSVLGILVYNEVTSIVPMMVLSRMFSVSLTFLMKSEVSDTCDLVSFTSGRRNMSTKADIFSVAQPFADIIGLPGDGVWFLGIFGRK